MNDYLPGRWQVHQENNVWYLSVGFRAEQSFTFADGITIMPDNTVKNVGSKDVRKLSKSVNAYAAKFIDALAEGKVPAPSGGDCWMCLMVSTGENKKTLGEMSGSDHLLSHISKEYFVPSLLIRALEAFPVSKWAICWLQEIWQNDVPECFCDISKRQLNSSLRKYIRRQVGLPS
jgi:hypothetical protein